MNIPLRTTSGIPMNIPPRITTMRIATLSMEGSETAGIVTDADVFPLDVINDSIGDSWPADVLQLLQTGQLQKLTGWYNKKGRTLLLGLPHLAVPAGEVRYAPLFRNPGKIWGIGLNYREHARDLNERSPTCIPASFMKPATTIIGAGDTIELPHQSRRTTGEAELGVVIGKACREVQPEDWLSVVAGFTPILDMTAEDILQQNPRYLTLSKSFDTFFSFGPQLITPDEVADIAQLSVSTVLNGEVIASNVISNMTFPPDYLVSFHSTVMTLFPGDVICTGTPGAAVLRDGDTLACRIDGFPCLENRVQDLKSS